VSLSTLLKHGNPSGPCSFADRDMFSRYAGIGVGHEAQFPGGRFQTVTPGQKLAGDDEPTDEDSEMSNDMELEEGDGLNSLSTDSSGYGGCEGSNSSGDDGDDDEMADLEELDDDNDDSDPDGTDEEECVGSNSESEDDDFTDGEDMISAFRF